MLRGRLKGPGGNQLLVVGITVDDLETLAEGPITIAGDHYGIGADKLIVIIAGADVKSIIAEIEAHLPVKFPRDESGDYIQVNA
jgi:hypothetical protein